MKATAERGDEKQIPHCGRNDKGFICRNDAGSSRNHEGTWARACATAGAAAWAGLAVLARMGIARLGAIELMFLFAPLVIVPLGMELGLMIGGGGWFEEAARRLQPVGAVLAVVAMWLPPGTKAGLAALGWMVVCVLMAAGGMAGIFRASWRDAGRSARATQFSTTLAIGRIDLAVGGAWLVASRLGMGPMGIQEPIGLLTAVHFHYAGFATATIAAATLASDERGRQRWLKRVVLLAVALPFVVTVGFVVSPALKMVAALLFSASVAALAVFLRACGKQVKEATARILLQVAAGTVFAGMVFSGAYAVVDFLGSEALTIPQMVRTHGILNAVGFCLPGLLGWLVESSGQGPEARGQTNPSKTAKVGQR